METTFSESQYIKIVGVCLFALPSKCVLLSEGYPAECVSRGAEETLGGRKSLSLKTARCVRIAVAA